MPFAPPVTTSTRPMSGREECFVGMHICFVAAYIGHSVEELRLADYAVGWRYPSAATPAPEQWHRQGGVPVGGGEPREFEPTLQPAMQYGVLPVTVKHQNLCFMPVYAKHSMEELRWQYYLRRSALCSGG